MARARPGMRGSIGSALLNGIAFLGVIILATIAIVGAVAFFSAWRDVSASSESSDASAVAKKAALRDEWKIRGKKAVLARLRDPDSAKFSNLMLVSQDGDADSYVLCGAVNSKNGFGGYTGNRVFLVAGELTLFDDGTPHFRKLFNQFCVNHGRATK